MFETFKGKIAFSGVTVLAIGVALLVFTFASAYTFLSGDLQVLTSQDLAQTFGGSLAPLIAASIRIMYLGVMGWIGSLITIRGVTIIANAPKTDLPEPQKPAQEPAQKNPQPVQQKTKKPAELQFGVIPLEEMEQQPTPTKPETS
jgi:hypothetical protein